MNAQKPCGRPSKLTPAVAERLVGLLAGGASVTAAANACGVSVRSVQAWTARAWSQRPQDRPYVELERRVQAARVEAAAGAPAPVEDWRKAAKRLEEMNPLRWGPAAPLDDVLDGW